MSSIRALPKWTALINTTTIFFIYQNNSSLIGIFLLYSHYKYDC